MKTLLYLVFIFCSSLLFSQADSVRVLSYSRFMELVSTEHPLAQAAELKIAKGNALLLKARGGFDPVLEGDFMQKDFNDKRYYELAKGGLKIPTWLGLTGMAGLSNNEGLFLNPQANTPNAGLFQAGIGLSLGQGLFIDDRRAQLRKAQIGLKLADAERTLMLNELLLEAGIAYWNWFLAFHSLDVFEEAQGLAQVRLDAVIRAAELGDRPFIDTLEASIQVQQRSFNLEQAVLEMMNSRAQLSVFLWMDGFIPLELEDTAIPELLADVIIENVDSLNLIEIENLINNHPYIQSALFGLEQLQIERRLKAEQLKPRIDLKYNALNEAIGDEFLNRFNTQDYSFGIDFKMPILMRKERGDLQLAKIKIQEEQLKLAGTRQDTWLKATTAMNEQNTTAKQARIYERTVSDYRKLWAGEQQLFFLGESSLFLVNSRETGYVQTKVKWIEMVSKNRMAVLKTNYSLSIINQ